MTPIKVTTTADGYILAGGKETHTIDIEARCECAIGIDKRVFFKCLDKTQTDAWLWCFGTTADALEWVEEVKL